MSLDLFHISETNPNDSVGGGGCICCGDGGHVKCEGPYAVFYASESASNLSPHVVLSLSCAKAFVELAEEEASVLSAGEKDPVVDSTAIEIKEQPAQFDTDDELRL